jgi:hypothetical protein
MDELNQFYENKCTSKNNLHVQCNPHQNCNNIHHRDRKVNPKVHMKTQMTSNNQSNPEQKRAMLEVSQYLTSNYATKP